MSTDATYDRAIDKIRKLLAIANDARGNEQERETALRQAYSLLAKHSLDIAAVGSTQQEEAREQQQVKLSVYPWARGIAHSLAGLFFCSYYFQRGAGKLATHSFIGRTSNALTASEMSQYIVSSVFKELRQRFGSETSPEARSFAVGVESALRRRCAELRKAAEEESKPVQQSTGRALVLADMYTLESKANQQWIDAHVGKLVTQKDRTKDVLGSAYAAGREHGGKISLARQVGGSTSSAKRIGN